MKKILITNDDGIRADGIRRLAEAARSFGEVWVIAPDSERSAASHSITLRTPFDVYPEPDFPVADVHAFSCTGMPADCIRVGVMAVMPQKPDVVLSGINHGYNMASDIQYSATCGAAFEGSFQGCHAIAFSEQACDCHEVSDAYLQEVLAQLIDQRLPEGQIYNVNFPGCTLDECRGILRERTVSRSMIFIDGYKQVEELERGGRRYMVDAQLNRECEENTDMRAAVEGFVSIGTVSNIG